MLAEKNWFLMFKLLISLNYVICDSSNHIKLSLCLCLQRSLFLPYKYCLSKHVLDTSIIISSFFLFIFFLCSWVLVFALANFVASTHLRDSCCFLGNLCGISQISPLGQCSDMLQEDIVHELQHCSNNLKDLLWLKT